MFAWLGRAMVRFRWTVLAVATGFVVVAAAWGTGVFGDLTNSNRAFADPASESTRAYDRIADEVGRQDADLLVLYSSATATVDEPAFRDAVTPTLNRLRDRPEVAEVISYYDTALPAFVSTDRRATYAVVRLTAGDFQDRTAAYEALRDDLGAPGLRTEVGGPLVIGSDISEQVSRDLGRAEAIAMPLLMLLLVFVFGSLVAASTPLLVGGLAILGAFTATRLLTMVTDVSIFSINVITILGLGLAIDYALFVVARFREELAAGRPVPDAVARTMQTAGRTVVVSGVTVALSLAGLLIFPQMFLRSMGFGGIAAVLVAMVASVTVLPALLAVLGHRVNALRLPLPVLFTRQRTASRAGRAGRAGNAAEGGWARLARSVMRRPVPYAVAITALLLALAAPVLGIRFGGVDERVLPAGTESRQVSETIARDFPGGDTEAIRVLVSGADPAAAAAYAERIRGLDGVTGVTVAGSRGDSSVVAVTYRGESTSTGARDLVGEIRALPAPGGAEVLVGGGPAEVVDLLASLGRLLPWVGLLVAAVTFVLLFLAFGSVLLPLKAIVMNVLSIGAAFGVLVLVFQDGNLAGLLGFTATGFIESNQPILILAILFGLSMDYEVFLLSRIREQWDRTGDNVAAVSAGMQRSGRIITSAALLMAVVVGAFTTSGITFIKMIGLGMLVAILVDATVVRALLVPATMRLLGRANWWAPSPLRRVYRRYGISEAEPAPAPA